MALPTITQPEFEITLPVIKRKVKFRPFLVKEEKVLLVGKEGTAQDQMRAIKQILKNVVLSPKNFNPGDLTSTDVEYLFMHLRGKSVNSVIPLKYKDKEDEQVYDFELDIETIEPTIAEARSYDIKLANGLMMQLKDPTIDIIDACGLDMESLKEGTDDVGEEEQDAMFKLIANCIVKVWDKSEVYDDFTIDEAITFVKSIDIKSFEGIQEFFDGAPKLTHTLSYKNSLGNDREIVLNGIADFF